MNLGFSKLLREINSELCEEYIPDAANWADLNLEFAWTCANERFDKALIIAIERKDYVLAQIEGDFYKASILDLISKYKRTRNIEEARNFLNSIEIENP